MKYSSSIEAEKPIFRKNIAFEIQRDHSRWPVAEALRGRRVDTYGQYCFRGSNILFFERSE